MGIDDIRNRRGDYTIGSDRGRKTEFAGEAAGTGDAKDDRGVFGREADEGYYGFPMSMKDIVPRRDAPSPAFGGFAPYDFGADSTATVQSVQTALNAAGYGPLTVDGQLGHMTSAALTKFQTDKSINPSGAIDDTTLTALGLAPTGTPILPLPSLGARIKAVFLPPPPATTTPGPGATATPTTAGAKLAADIAGFLGRVKAVFVPAPPVAPPPAGP